MKFLWFCRLLSVCLYTCCISWVEKSWQAPHTESEASKLIVQRSCCSMRFARPWQQFASFRASNGWCWCVKASAKLIGDWTNKHRRKGCTEGLQKSRKGGDCVTGAGTIPQDSKLIQLPHIWEVDSAVGNLSRVDPPRPLVHHGRFDSGCNHFHTIFRLQKGWMNILAQPCGILAFAQSCAHCGYSMLFPSVIRSHLDRQELSCSASCCSARHATKSAWCFSWRQKGFATWDALHARQIFWHMLRLQDQLWNKRTRDTGIDFWKKARYKNILETKQAGMRVSQEVASHPVPWSHQWSKWFWDLNPPCTLVPGFPKQPSGLHHATLPPTSRPSQQHGSGELGQSVPYYLVWIGLYASIASLGQRNRCDLIEHGQQKEDWKSCSSSDVLYLSTTSSGCTEPHS